MRTQRRPLTFEVLAHLAPGLRDLLAEARRAGREAGPGFCARRAWDGLRDRLRHLTGPHAAGAAGPRLRSAEAFDVAATRLEAVLTPCRHRGACR
jgi:hypothetical protein